MEIDDARFIAAAQNQQCGRTVPLTMKNGSIAIDKLDDELCQFDDARRQKCGLNSKLIGISHSYVYVCASVCCLCVQ